MEIDYVVCPKCGAGNLASDTACVTCGTLLHQQPAIQNLTCPFCRTLVEGTDFFCPICGKKIREKPLSSSSLTQIGTYLVSFFLPPLGLWPAWKYLRQSDPQRKQIGILAILLTLVGIGVSIVIAISLVNQITAQINLIILKTDMLFKNVVLGCPNKSII